jgi:hypothetical protein
LDFSELPTGRFPCVYFIFDDDDIVYVGQTMGLKTRIQAHSARHRRVAFIKTDSAHLNEMEALYIAKFRCSGNGNFPPNDHFIPKSKARVIVAKYAERIVDSNTRVDFMLNLSYISKEDVLIIEEEIEKMIDRLSQIPGWKA